MSNAIITLAIAATAGAFGGIQDLGTGRDAELRKFDLRAGLASGDVVAVYGSADGTTFDPVLLPAPDNGPAVPLQLSYGRASASINDKSRYYRTKRVTVGTGSTLTACGLTVGVTPEGSATSAITLAVPTSGFGAAQDLGTDAAPELRKFDLRAGLVSGDVVAIYSSSDNTTFTPLLLPAPDNGPAVPLQLSYGRASATINDRARYYKAKRVTEGDGSSLTECGLLVSSQPANVIHDGGDSVGADITIGTTDAFSLKLIAGGDVFLESDGTTTLIGGANPDAAVEIDVNGAGGFFQVAATAGANVDIQSTTADINLLAATGVRLRPFGAAAGNTTVLQFCELQANGSNFIGFKAPDAIGANVTWALPATDATIAGQCLSSDAAGALSWKGRVVVRATTTNAQSIADGAAAAVVTTWTEAVDTASAFNATTGVFTCPAGQGGAYVLSAELEYSAIASIVAGEFTVQAFKNGVLVASGVEICQVAAANVKRNPKVCVVVDLGPSDTLDIRASQNSGSGANTLTAVGTRNVISIAGPF